MQKWKEILITQQTTFQNNLHHKAQRNRLNTYWKSFTDPSFWAFNPHEYVLLSAELFWLHHIRVSVFFSTLLNDLKQKGLNRETYFGAPVRTGQSWIKTLAEVAGSLTDVGTGCCDEEGKTLATLTADLDYCGECCRGHDCLVFYMQWKLYNNNCPELNLKLIVIHYIHTIKKMNITHSHC